MWRLPLTDHTQPCLSCLSCRCKEDARSLAKPARGGIALTDCAAGHWQRSILTSSESGAGCVAAAGRGLTHKYHYVGVIAALLHLRARYA
jgi:hypothetical protein